MALEGFQEKYVNPFTDYGFKRLFGEEYNKELLLDFLNELLKDQHGPITQIRYMNSEHLGSGELDRRAVFDLYCETESGEKLIVEIQKTKQKFFKDRTLYYSTFPIREQVRKGEWDYRLEPVYTVAILDFVFDEDTADPGKFRYDVKLADIETSKVFYDKLTFIYLEMPKFTKTPEECHTRFEKWLYLLRNLHRLERIPERFRERIFKKLLTAAEIARFTPTQAREYEDSLKVYRDLKNSFDTAREDGWEDGYEDGLAKGLADGVAKGKSENRLEMAANMLANGISPEVIQKVTGLPLAEIQALTVRKPTDSVKEPPAPYGAAPVKPRNLKSKSSSSKPK